MYRHIPDLDGKEGGGGGIELEYLDTDPPKFCGVLHAVKKEGCVGRGGGGGGEAGTTDRPCNRISWGMLGKPSLVCVIRIVFEHHDS